MLPSSGTNRFCQQCDKTIIDFTHHSEEEILSYLLLNPNTCGRVLQKNVRHKPMPPTTSVPKSPFPYLRKWLQTLVLLSLTQGALVAQQQIIKPIFVEGIVKDKDSKQAIPFAVATLYLYEDDGSLVELDRLNTSEKAEFRFEIQANNRYKLVGNQEGYLANEAALSTIGIDSIGNDTLFLKRDINIQIEPVEYLAGYPLHHCYFNTANTASYNLTESAVKELDMFIKMLKSNPTVTLQVGSHTSSNEAGENTYLLSEKRAHAVIKYFVEGGIDAERLSWRSYGDTALIYENEKNEMEKQVNQRVEFRITSFDYKKAKP